MNRGPVFVGEIGPSYRRAYTVMGDTTNLAAIAGRVLEAAGRAPVTASGAAQAALRHEVEVLPAAPSAPGRPDALAAE